MPCARCLQLLLLSSLCLHGPSSVSIAVGSLVLMTQLFFQLMYQSLVQTRHTCRVSRALLADCRVCKKRIALPGRELSLKFSIKHLNDTQHRLSKVP